LSDFEEEMTAAETPAETAAPIMVPRSSAVMVTFGLFSSAG
jgi:hypothetical protein